MSLDLLNEGQKGQIVETLIRITKADKLTWDQLSAHDFIAYAKHFSYRVTSRDMDDAPPFDLSIYDERQAPALRIDWISTAAFSSLNEPLTELYDLVKRKVLGLDTTVDDLFAELNELEEDPPS